MGAGTESQLQGLARHVAVCTHGAKKLDKERLGNRVTCLNGFKVLAGRQ